MFRNRPVSLALVGLFVWLTACTSYKQIGLSEDADHGKVRVTLTDGERETIHDPRVEADSIRGRVNGAEWGMPLDQIADAEAVGVNVVGTVFTALGVTLFLGALVCAAACPPLFSTGDWSWSP